MKLSRICIIIIGILFLALSVYAFKESRDFRSRSEKTTGTVTEVIIGSRKKWKRYRIWYEYVVNGEKFVGWTKVSSRSIDVGDNITVWYDRDNPSHRSLDNMSYLDIIPFVLISAALIFYGLKPSKDEG